MDTIRVKQQKKIPALFESEIPQLARCYLHDDDALIFVASIADQAVGYLLASVEEATRSGEVEAMGVMEPYRRRGVGTHLLSALEQALAERNCLVVTKLYEASAPSVTAIEGLLHCRQWKDPQLFIQRYHFNVQAFHPPWFERDYPLPVEFDIFPWSQLTAEDERLIERQLEGGTFSANVYPLGNDKDLIEPLNSLGMRHQGVLIGWMVTHRVAPDTIRYSYFYVRDDYRHQGYSVRLLVDAIRLQQASSVPEATFEIRQSRVAKRWQRFIKRRLAPFSKETTQVRMAWKDLRDHYKERPTR